MRPKEKGFSLLLEMLIVCTVMLVLAAIAVPNIVQMQVARNQVAAKIQIRNVAQAEIDSVLCAAQSGCVLPAGATKIIPLNGTMNMGGYSFVFSTGASWAYTATPLRYGLTGHYAFYTDGSGVIRCADNATPTVSSSPCP